MSTAVTLAPVPVFRAWDNNGNPLFNGQLFTYVAGSSTPQATYIDSTGTTPNSNPVILNARGEASVWLATGLTYKLTLQDSLGNQIWSVDQIPGGLQITQALFNSFLGGVTINGVANGAPQVLFSKTSAYAGGTVGFVNPTVMVQANVTSCGNNYEWAFLSVMNNSSSTGQNVAVYGQGNRQLTTAGATWGGVMEVREVVALNDPTVGLVGLEVDNRSNGTDANFNRVGIDVVAARYNTGGAATTCSWGVRVQANNDANVTITNGFSVWHANVGIAFDCGNALSVASGSLRMPQSVPILFDTTGTPAKLMSQGLGLDHFGSGGTAVNRLLNAGGLSVATGGVLTQVVGPRITGYGTPTGGVNQGSFAAGSITLPNLAAGVAQLILDLKTHGLLGT